MMTLPFHPNLTKQVYDAIVADIVQGRLRPGERIVQEQIADLLGVSRQPVQQAVLLLRNEGLLHDGPGRGVIVAPLDLARVRTMYEVRAVLEGLAFRKAAMINSERARRLAPALLAQGHEAVASGSVPLMVAADMKFHGFIYDLAVNPLIGSTLQAQWACTQRVMAEALWRDEASRDIWNQHECMIDAVIAADGDKAERLAREHIMESAEFMIDRLRNGPDDAVSSGPPPPGSVGHVFFPLNSTTQATTAARRCNV